ncbi:MAG: glycosyltransferase involved in cell wall biosynthesis [Bacteroidia bacterium]|jgi:glycosyltransferase involved in cell wall biosynthesis
MRILITSPVFPPDLGGPAVYVPSAAKFFVDAGHEVEVLAFCSEPKVTGFPFKVTTISRGNLLWRYIKAFWFVFREARKVDVVYVQEHIALFHVLGARLAGKPVVIRIMVDGAWEISHRFGLIGDDSITTFETKDYGAKVKLIRAVQLFWWKRVYRIIACSDFLRWIPIKRYGLSEEKVLRVHNAYNGPKVEDVTETKAEARVELGLDADKRYVLTICRLVVWKGVDYIQRALVNLPKDVHLLVAGDGELQEQWTALSAELGIADRVTFLGNVPHARIPLYIRATDLFVLNSEYEGLSHTLLEVASLGTPIVCTGVCGNPEVVEHEVNGLLVQPKSPDELGPAMLRVLDDPVLAQRFVEAGLVKMKGFRRETTFPQVLEILDSAVRNG